MLKFYRGKREDYTYTLDNIVDGLKDVIYFATDTGELLMNGKAYGEDSEKVVKVTTTNSEAVFTMADGTTSSIHVGMSEEEQAALADLKALLDEDGNLKIDLAYTPNVSDSLTTGFTVGGVNKGIKAEDLKNKSFSELFDMLFFPDIDPVMATDASATLALKSPYTATMEVGKELPYLIEHFTVGHNQGQVKLDGVLQGPYAGTMTSDTLKKGNGVLPLSEAPILGAETVTYTYTVVFGAGAKYKNNKGVDSKLAACPADYSKSKSVTITGVYPAYATTTALGTDTKLSLTTGKSYNAVKLVAQTDNEKVCIKVKGEIAAISELNTLSGKYEAQNINTAYTKSTETRDLNGQQVVYTVYTNNAGAQGSITVNFTLE